LLSSKPIKNFEVYVRPTLFQQITRLVDILLTKKNKKIIDSLLLY
jgi:hypothetical protein